MISIEIDKDIFDYLKNHAEPFIDTPNTVLRRIIFSSTQPNVITSTKQVYDSNLSKEAVTSSIVFVSSYLKGRYGDKFRAKAPFRTMFESETHLIYFQNFNKLGTTNLWYRLSENSLKILRETKKIAMVCLTNPSEQVVLEIPIQDIDNQISKCNWKKDFLEVNIDPGNLRWRELDWNIERYLVKL